MAEAGAPSRHRITLAIVCFALAAGLWSAAGAQEPTARPSPSPRAATRPAAAPADAIIVPEGWFRRIEPKIPTPKLPDEITRAFVIPVREPITMKTSYAIERKIKRCRRSGAQLVIFDFNTPGGRSDAMTRIAEDLIMDNLRDVYTVAYVNPNAYSAGAVIALATNEIVMSPTGKIGDAMPIMIGTDGSLQPLPKEERGKVESFARVEIRSIAEQRGRNADLAEGMITLSIEIWLIRHRTTGELKLVNADKVRGRIGNAPASTQPAMAENSAEDWSQWSYVRTIDDATTLATRTADESLSIGLSTHTFASMQDLLKFYHVAAEAVVLEDTWSETLVEFLTSPGLVSVLMLVGIICIYMEFQHPGLILPAVIGGLCFAIIFGGHYLSGMAEWWDIALFVLGVVLIVAELFLPTFGLLAIAGGLCCIIGLLSLAVPLGPDKWPIPRTDMDWALFNDMAVPMGLAIIGAFFAILLIARHLPRLPLAGRLLLAPIQTEPDTSLTNDSPVRRLRAGDVGVVEASCRPVGKVRFGNDLVDAVTEGAMVEAGARVRVLRREGNQVFVEKV